MSNGQAIKKPIPIDWFRFDNNQAELASWMGTFGDAASELTVVQGKELRILTMEGHSYPVPDGYIIIRGIKGEYYPCDPQVFTDSYEII